MHADRKRGGRAGTRSLPEDEAFLGFKEKTWS